MGLTTRTPQFLGLNEDTNTAITTNDIIKVFDSGSNIIIGILNTGIFLEHDSFNDEDLGPIPSHWKGKCIASSKWPRSVLHYPVQRMILKMSTNWVLKWPRNGFVKLGFFEIEMEMGLWGWRRFFFFRWRWRWR